MDLKVKRLRVNLHQLKEVYEMSSAAVASAPTLASAIALFV